MKRYCGLTAAGCLVALFIATAPAGAQVGEVLIADETISAGVSAPVYYDPGTHYFMQDLPGAGRQESPEIRIMNRILSTALAAVEAPELPAELTAGGNEGEGWQGVTVVERDVLATGQSYRYISGSSRPSRVSGFYMNGYGYLFTITWNLRSRAGFGVGLQGDMVLALQEQNEQIAELLARRSEARAGAGERARATEPETEERVEETLQERRARAERQAALYEEWQTAYEDRVIEALRTTLATYGHTLTQAEDTEAITLLFEQGNEEEHNLTLTVQRGRLGGPGEIEQARQAIQVSRGTNDMSDALRTQVDIMDEIIAESFRGFTSGREGESLQAYEMLAGTYVSASGIFGGSRARYLPGYGVIFNRSARLSSVIAIEADVPVPATESSSARGITRNLRTVLDNPEESLVRLEEHLEALKEKTAEILATYGTTLTELDDNEWVGFNYDVGSGAALLQSGVSRFLVQARMSDVRQAARQSDAVAWLLEHLVTNQRSE